MNLVPANEISEREILALLLKGEISPSALEGMGVGADHFHTHGRLYNAIRDYAGHGGGNVPTFLAYAIDKGIIDQIGTAGTVLDIANGGLLQTLPQHVQHLRKTHGQRLVMQAGATLATDPTNADALAKIDAGRAEIELAAASKATAFDHIHHGDISETNEGAFDFVEDVLTDGAASVIYGASNSGKTFFAIDLGAHVATGARWQEKEIESGAVIYIALEGEQGARNRIKAMQIRGKLPQDAPFFLCFAPVNLLDPKHPQAVSEMIQNISKGAGIPVRLVIIDTLARAMAGGDENSGMDMGKAVATIDAVRASTGAHVMLIHHSGKDTAKGARGHSCLRAAIDTEIEVIHPEGEKYRTATIVKQRDLGTIPPLCFSLEVVEVGTNRRGKPITSCIVKEEDGIMAHKKGKAGAKKQYTCEMILDLLPQPSVKEWQIAAKNTFDMSSDTFGDRKRECASQWEKVGNQIIKKTIQNQELWGNGGIEF
jgi:AAA domain